ncbi:ficolin-2 isoform X2 [Stomoxys calcitrans]|uniref:ficolin-2 isoform X2 n=1 Tax=Stomoxys calcitrans TaxID=35570 RepID=UPI0027E37258|nr:ficolin-2 isoform X2 [Stomoxys calcitrans]
MKTLYFCLYLGTIFSLGISANTTPSEYYDPNEDPHSLILWKNLFDKVNSLLENTDQLHSKFLDMSKRIDEISKRQEEQQIQLDQLMKFVQQNSKGLNATVENNSKVTLNEKPELSPQPKPTTEWTTILRRQDGSVDFYRNWTEYKNGFGNPPNGEFFIGLDRLHELTSQGPPQELTVVLRDWKNEERYANYSLFKIDNEAAKYKILALGNYDGNAGNAMAYHMGQAFSTFDQDNDGMNSANCAKRWHGAWWYNRCYNSNLCAIYRQEHDKFSKGINWMQWKGDNFSLKYAEMKIRPKQ